jgi:hypothetical protein
MSKKSGGPVAAAFVRGLLYAGDSIAAKAFAVVHLYCLSGNGHA